MEMAKITTSESITCRPLLYAYVARSKSQSVTFAAYQTMLEVAKLADATVIAHANDREDLEKSELARFAKIHYAGSRLLTKLLRGLGVRLFGESWRIIEMLCIPDMILFEIHVLIKASRLSRLNEIDLIHRVNPRTLRAQSFAARWFRRPVVSGVHLCGMTWPRGFEHLSGGERRFLDPLLSFDQMGHWLVGDYGSYARILVHDESTRRVLGKKYARKAEIISGIGIEGELPQSSACAGDVRQLLFVGRLVPFKGVDIALRALADVPDEIHLTVVGDGPEREKLIQLSEELGISGRVTFIGKVARTDVWNHYKQAGVFLFPSVKESGGAVVLEAMALGLPCIAADWGGPAELITTECGYKIAVDGLGPDGLRIGLVHAINEMYRNPSIGRAMSISCRARVKDRYLWSSIGAHIVQVYDEVLAKSGVATSAVLSLRGN
jgi:glycosyltransferase involved in cell wall biosynthesis